MKTLYWVIVIAVVIAIIYYMNNRYNPLPAVLGDMKVPDQMDPKTGNPKIDVGYSNQDLSAIAMQQTFPTGYRPYSQVPQNPIA